MPLKAEDFSFIGKNNTALLVCVHSHASIKACLSMLSGYTSVHLVDIPCCYKSDIERSPNISFEDPGIHSEKRLVNVYFNLERQWKEFL